MQASTPVIAVIGRDAAALSLLQAQIELRGFQGCVEVCHRELSAARKRVAEPADLFVLHDPDADLVEQARQCACIVISPQDFGSDGETMSHLAPDYTVLDLIDSVGLHLDMPAPGNLIQELRMVRDLSESERRYRDLFDRGSDAILVIEQKTHVIVAANERACTLYNYHEKDLVGMYMLGIVDVADHVVIFQTARGIDQGAKPADPPPRRLHVKQSGERMRVSVSGALLSVGDFTVYQDILRDETDRIAHEEQLERLVQERTRALIKEQDLLRQAQKMEAIGRTTGGIAHDFNNLLGVVIGNNELLVDHVATDEKAQRYLSAALTAAKHGVKLTSQLMAFARQQPLNPEVIEPQKLLADLKDYLAVSLDDAIAVDISCRDGTDSIEADQAQLLSALLNLSLNARDAMPSGGRLEITAFNTDVDPTTPWRRHDLLEGAYVCFRVRDDGVGIAADALDKIFEPFFTTKDQGQGTGLGLSMVHGFVNQSGGQIRVESTCGAGSHFFIYLPAHT